MKRGAAILLKVILPIAMAVALIRLALAESHPLDPVLDTAAFVLVIAVCILSAICERADRKTKDSAPKE